MSDYPASDNNNSYVMEPTSTQEVVLTVENVILGQGGTASVPVPKAGYIKPTSKFLMVLYL